MPKGKSTKMRMVNLTLMCTNSLSFHLRLFSNSLLSLVGLSLYSGLPYSSVHIRYIIRLVTLLCFGACHFHPFCSLRVLVLMSVVMILMISAISLKFFL
ncbi:hypothetical protein DFH11DRAFT_1570748 [Phellopilus nigrolimitatus]|nr:hypothetical protein DFH11DRAFT_1570748 [Phellopilus nigrolimitatus]